MNVDLGNLLKKVVEGDQAAREDILQYFKEQVFSSDQQEQVHIFLKSVEHKSHHVIYLRALLYEYGYGVKVDLDMAFILMRDAAAKGNSKAIYKVGHYYLQGVGIDQQYENALNWLKVAAVSPHYVDEAMFDLGRMYEQGLGVEANQEQAKMWYERMKNRKNG